MSRCLTDFTRELSKYKGRRHVVLSDESWGPQAWKTWEDYHTLQEVLGSEWQVTVVVGYRPLFQWLRSDMFQRYRLDRPIDWKDEWPAGSQRTKGQVLQPLFPDYYKYDNWYHQKGHRFTDFVVRNAKGRVHLRVMNLVQQGSNTDTLSLRTKFVCHMLPDAPHTCATSRRLDTVQQQNHGGDGGGNGEIKLNAHDHVLHVHYDMLATRAAERGLVDIRRHSRVQVREALRNWTETELQRTPMDFDLSCPTPTELDEFLNLSLELEKECLGMEWAAQVEEETRAAFQADVDSKVFCSIDADANLKKEPWMSFLKQFGHHKSSSP